MKPHQDKIDDIGKMVRDGKVKEALVNYNKILRELRRAIR